MPQLVDWFELRYDRYFLITGEPGTGKSIPLAIADETCLYTVMGRIAARRWATGSRDSGPIRNVSRIAMDHLFGAPQPLQRDEFR